MLQTTDPVTREIIKNALMSAADTMALTVVRTARSAVIKHGMDFSTALFNAEGPSRWPKVLPCRPTWAAWLRRWKA